MTAHIIISVLGIVALAAYTVTTKKDWKIPALEIIMRAFYGIALITGGIILKVTLCLKFCPNARRYASMQLWKAHLLHRQNLHII